MKIKWKRIKNHEVKTHVSCLVTTQLSHYEVLHLTVAFKTNQGEWKLGNGEVCWFEPIYFAYLNEYWEEDD